MMFTTMIYLADRRYGSDWSHHVSHTRYGTTAQYVYITCTVHCGLGASTAPDVVTQCSPWEIPPRVRIDHITFCQQIRHRLNIANTCTRTQYNDRDLDWRNGGGLRLRVSTTSRELSFQAETNFHSNYSH
ncbi:hypothetical protein BaRGS_00019827 [Batillaria attramentaria]|uniref:Uncharacterized protein n=1 Tax=Batillaria attramentaria TaxID=370345 RepID=A0ABD0KPA7_9CAEN